MICPTCGSTEMTLLGQTAEGWLYLCDGCDRQLIFESRTVETGGRT